MERLSASGEEPLLQVFEASQQAGKFLPGLSKDEVHVTGPGKHSLQHRDGNSRQDKGRVKRFVDVVERTTSEPAPTMEK